METQQKALYFANLAFYCIETADYDAVLEHWEKVIELKYENYEEINQQFVNKVVAFPNVIPKLVNGFTNSKNWTYIFGILLDAATQSLSVRKLALEELHNVLLQAPEEAYLYEVLSYFYGINEEFQHAVDVAHIGLRLCREDEYKTRIHLNLYLGIALYKLDCFDESVQAFEAILETVKQVGKSEYPSSVLLAHSWLAKVFKKSGNEELHQKHMNQYIVELAEYHMNYETKP